MGGFLLYKTYSSLINHDSALNTFKRKKQKVVGDVAFGDYRLITFSKRSFENKNIFCFENGDFVASLGTPIYKDFSGEEAALELYNDFRNDVKIDFRNFLGHFCYILFFGGKLVLFNDFNGIYHIYHDSNHIIFSNLFLAVSNSLKNKSVSTQGLYEYIFYGATYGNDTIIENIHLLTSKKIIQLKPEFVLLDKVFKQDDINLKKKINFNEWVEIISEDLADYFRIITKNYGQFSLGLSGGFDSRLILALLLKCNIKPLIYTHGNPNNTEVKISKNICNFFELEFINFYETESVDFNLINLKQILEKKFFSDDGFNLFGIFHSTLSNDEEISKKAKTNLNGMGGEIYRYLWNFNGNPITLNNFLKLRFIHDFRFNFSKNFANFGTKKFAEAIFFENIKRKIINSLDLNPSSHIIVPPLNNLIYSNFKLMNWTARTCCKINQFSYSLLPFSEPFLYLTSIHIPLKHRIAGKFEAALIKKINPELAKINSNYVFNFFDGPNSRTQMKEWCRHYYPAFLGNFIPSHLKYLLRSKRNLPGNNLKKTKELGELIFNQKMWVSEYINEDKIITQIMYSRLLTMEYFLRNNV